MPDTKPREVHPDSPEAIRDPSIAAEVLGGEEALAAANPETLEDFEVDLAEEEARAPAREEIPGEPTEEAAKPWAGVSEEDWGRMGEVLATTQRESAGRLAEVGRLREDRRAERVQVDDMKTKLDELLTSNVATTEREEAQKLEALKADDPYTHFRQSVAADVKSGIGKDVAELKTAMGRIVGVLDREQEVEKGRSEMSQKLALFQQQERTATTSENAAAHAHYQRTKAYYVSQGQTETDAGHRAEFDRMMLYNEGLGAGNANGPAYLLQKELYSGGGTLWRAPAAGAVAAAAPALRAPAATTAPAPPTRTLSAEEVPPAMRQRRAAGGAGPALAYAVENFETLVEDDLNKAIDAIAREAKVPADAAHDMLSAAMAQKQQETSVVM